MAEAGQILSPLTTDRAAAADELAALLTSGISLLSADYHAALMSGSRTFGTCRPAIPYMAAMDNGTDAADVTPVKAGQIAILPIHGPTVQRSSFLTQALGIPTYDAIRAAAASLKADPSVAGVVLHIDSHGGEASGVLELGADLPALFGKPVYASIEGSGQSAAFALASGAQRIFGAPSARMPNIGILIPHVDRSGAMAQAGIKVSYTYRGDHKIDGAETGPLTPAAQAETDKYADQLYSSFVRLVATNRGMSQRDVRATEARSYMADEAKALGLIDEVGSLSDAVSALRAKIGRSSSAPRGSTAQPSAPTGAEGNQMQTAAFLAALGLANETDEAKVIASLTTLKTRADASAAFERQATAIAGDLAAMKASDEKAQGQVADFSAKVAALETRLAASEKAAARASALEAEVLSAELRAAGCDAASHADMTTIAMAKRKDGETFKQTVDAMAASDGLKRLFTGKAPETKAGDAAKAETPHSAEKTAGTAPDVAHMTQAQILHMANRREALAPVAKDGAAAALAALEPPTGEPGIVDRDKARRARSF